MALDYFYDGQIKRYLIHFNRIFSGFQWESGANKDGTVIRRTVPAKLAITNRQVGHILRNNSENTLSSTPQISCYIQSLSVIRERTQDPNFVRTIQIAEREIDPTTGRYTNELGRSYTVKEYMPVPYELTMQVDLWTSNELQKQQIMEQILMLFNPSIDLQTGVNAADWTQLTVVELTDITWSNRSIPIGTDSDIDIVSMTFKMVIALSPPAKVTRQTIINQIVSNIIDSADRLDHQYEEYDEGYPVDPPMGDLMTRVITTPGDRMIRVNGNEITLLYPGGNETGPEGYLSWKDLLREYGRFETNVSQLRLKTQENLDIRYNDIVGVMELDPYRPNVLYWTIDISTLPANTLDPIDAIINPHQAYPGKHLPAVENGQRYLIYDNVDTCEAWGVISARMNNIIQRINGRWEVVWAPSSSTGVPHMLNKKTSKQLKWNGVEWVFSIDGDYRPGMWRIYL